MVTIKAEFISVGNPQRYQAFFEASIEYLRGEFRSMGIPYESHTSINNTSAQLFQGIREAIIQSGLAVVLVSPEASSAQMVKEAICKGLQIDSQANPQAVALLQKYAARHGNSLTPDEINQFAQLPQGAIALPNHGGPVQGYAFPAKEQLILVLPSTPSELSTLFSAQVRQLLQPYHATAPAESPVQPPAQPIAHSPVHPAAHAHTVQRTLRAFPSPRTPLPTLLQPLMGLGNPTIQLQEQLGDYQIILTAAADTKEAAESLCDQTTAKLKMLLGTSLYSTNGASLDKVAAQKLHALDKTLAVAESGSEGLLAQCFGPPRQDGPLLVFAADVPDRLSKQKTLGISEDLLAKYGGSSRQAAAAMALGALQKGNADLGLAIAGIFSAQVKGRFPLGTIHIALTDGQQVWIRSFRLSPGESPQYYSSTAVLHACNLLRLYCQSFPKSLSRGMSPTAALTHAGEAKFPLSSLLHRYLGAKQSPRSTLIQPSSHQANNTQRSLVQRLRTGSMDTSDKIRLGVIGLCALVFVGCIAYIGSVYLESYNNVKLNDSLSAMLEEKVPPEEIAADYPRDYQTKFATLYAQNSDVAGWIKIPDTKVNYVVVQAKDNTTYDRTDFSRSHNNHGVPFVDFRVAQQKPSANTVIYAHNMNDGQMFGQLMGYKSLSYYQQHPLISYDSVYYDGQYKIFGIVICKQDDPEFNYHNFIEAPNDSAMLEYIAKIRERSLINTKVDVGAKDKLLTLSTCDYSFKSAKGERIARFVVFARKVREGESLQVNTAGATLNLNPVMPQEWYDKLAREQEAERKAQEAAQAPQIATQWLTSQELSTLPEEDQAHLASLRQTDAAKYLTYDERENTRLSLTSKLELMSNRKALFQLFLYNDEEQLSISERLSLLEERRQEALKYLTATQLEALHDYEEVLDAIEMKKIALSADAKWLTREEATTLPEDARKALISQRQALAQGAGLTAQELSAAGSWSDIQTAIAQKQQKNLLVKENYPYLDNDELDWPMADLQATIASRKAQALEARLTEEELRSSANWSQTQQLIQQKTSKNAFVAANAPYLNSGELGGTLAQLQDLVESRKAQAAEVSISDSELASCQNWDALYALIAQKKAAQENDPAYLKNIFLRDKTKLKFLTIDTVTASLEQLQKNYQENLAYAQKYLTDAEISACDNWNELLQRIQQKNQGGNTDPPIKPEIGFSP